MNFEENDRAEEWFLIIGDWFRSTHRRWFYALLLVIAMAIPLQIFLKYSFRQVFVSSISELRVNYEPVTKLPLEVVETKVFDLGNGTYSGYARVKNNNSDWGVPEQKYIFAFLAGSGEQVMASSGATFILPFSEKIIAFPRFQSDKAPNRINFTLQQSEFIRPPQLPVVNFEIQRRSLSSEVNQTIVSAVIVNRSPFRITRVDLPVLLFDNQNRIIGVNYTNINDLTSNESRSFQYTWFNRINNVSRIEIIPELNPYNRDIFGAVPGQNPFDDLE